VRDDELDLAGVDQRAHTGTLPQDSQIDLALDEAYRRALSHREGRVAGYIPILGAADPEAFGLCIADVRGGLHEAGDTRTRFSIQSISKAFVYALVCEGIGHHEVRELVGVDNTGLPFNSVMAVAGALLVGLLAGNITAALAAHPELPDEAVAQVPLDSVNFVSNDRLRDVLTNTDLTETQVDAAVQVNEDSRLSALRLGLLILAGVSAIAIVPASRLPKYRPGEVPESVAAGDIPDDLTDVDKALAEEES
jgi:hypothetical protein